MTPNKPDLDRIEGLARAATPGPWFYRPEKHDDWGYVRGGPADEDGRYWLVATARSGGYQTEDDMRAHRLDGTDPYGDNAAYIAALDPQTVLALISYARELEGALAAATSGKPDYVYDPDDWEATFEWEDRRDLVDELYIGDLKRLHTLRNGPDVWAAHVVNTRDDAGDPDETEIVFFDTEEAARAALSRTQK